MNISKLHYLRALLPSLRFCLRYFPLKTALRLPVLLYKPQFRALKGTVRIESRRVRFGMVKMGFPAVGLFPNSGIIFENNGGSLIFCGEARIGNASALSIGTRGTARIGHDFSASAALKMVAWHNVTIGKHCRIGWDCLLTDTDFHCLKKESGERTRGYAPIRIGEHCWIGARCFIQKRTELPPYTVVSGYSLVNRKYDIPERSIIGGIPAELKTTGVYRDIEDDEVIYP